MAAQSVNGPGVGLLAGLWGMVLLEAISPIPALLTLGAAYVLLVRPPGFLRLVLRLCDREPSADDAA